MRFIWISLTTSISTTGRVELSSSSSMKHLECRSHWDFFHFQIDFVLKTSWFIRDLEHSSNSPQSSPHWRLPPALTNFMNSHSQLREFHEVDNISSSRSANCYAQSGFLKLWGLWKTHILSICCAKYAFQHFDKIPPNTRAERISPFVMGNEVFNFRSIQKTSTK
jgi:hypothetical protein